VVCQLLGDILWGFAINVQTSIPMMVIEEPAKPLLADLKTQVIASGYGACAGKAFNNIDDTSYPLVGYLLRHFEGVLIYNFLHYHLSLNETLPKLRASGTRPERFLFRELRR